MNDKKPKITRNRGKVEFIANLTTVTSKLAEGFNFTNIYNELVQEGLFTMTYAAFCHHCRKHFQQERPNVPPKQEIKPNLRIPPSTATPKTGFLKPEDVDVNTLF